MQVDIGIRSQTFVFLIGDVDAAGKTGEAVDDHDLAVRADVDLRPPQFAQIERMEKSDFDAGIAQRLQEPFADILGTHPVQQQTHFDAAQGLPDQGIADARAGGIGFENVILEMDVMVGRVERLFECGVGGGTVFQQIHMQCAARRESGSGGIQAHQRIGIVGKIGFGQRQQAGARLAAFQVLPFDPGRAEEVVDQEADVRQQDQRQQPAQGGDRLALLQQDPGAEQQHIQQPEQAEHQRNVRPCRLQVRPAAQHGLDHACFP